MNVRTFLKGSLLVASLLWATSFQAAAQAPGGGGGGGGGGRGGMGVLTQEQRTKMREAIADEMTPLREKLTAAEKDVAKAVLADAATSDIKSKLEAVQKIQMDMALLRLKGLKAIASTLTAEQKSQLAEMPDGGYNMLLGMMGGGRGGRGGGGGGGGGGGRNN
jgi:Spy/CpxP family protein refolding chaperone